MSDVLAAELLVLNLSLLLLTDRILLVLRVLGRTGLRFSFNLCSSSEIASSSKDLSWRIFRHFSYFDDKKIDEIDLTAPAFHHLPSHLTV